MIEKALVCALVIGLVGCGSDSTTTTNVDNRVCVNNQLTPAEEEAALEEEAFIYGLQFSKASPGVSLCGDPVTIDFVVETQEPELLAKTLTEGEME